MELTDEEVRLREARKGIRWRQWGPYLSERQWGTVREDYSDNGDAWNHFTHDQSRSRAYRWGEDGMAGVSDDKSQLCLSLALWKGQDPNWGDNILFYEHFHGDNGAGIGASHQSGWTGVVARPAQMFASADTARLAR